MSRPGHAFDGTRQARERRPEYEADRKRRRAFVTAHLRQHGVREGQGVWTAVCQVCGVRKTLPLSEWWADHIHAVADGGSEHGPLRISCKACQITQGSQVANARNPRAQPRRRQQEDHPGLINKKDPGER